MPGTKTMPSLSAPALSAPALSAPSRRGAARPAPSRSASSASSPRTDDGTLSDIDLLSRTRAGDDGAFGELWSRHVRVGMAVARRVTLDFDAADIVSEAFTRILQAIRNGSGPREEFRGYLTTTIRAVAASWALRARQTVDLDSVAEPAVEDERLAAIDELESSHRVVSAFLALPERWRTALWYSTVEGRTNTEIGTILELKPTAVAMLTLRARAGLRKEWDALSPEPLSVS